MPRPDEIDNVAGSTLGTSMWANSVADAVNEIADDLYGVTALEIPWSAILGEPATFDPTTASTVTAQTAYGSASTAGAAATASRGDHAHGTPALASTVAAETTYGASSTAGAGVTASKGDHSHGTPALPTAAQVGAAAAYTSPATAAGGKRIYVGTATPTGASEGDVWVKG